MTERVPNRPPSQPKDPKQLAIRHCIFKCLENGWTPRAEEVYSLVALKEEWLRGERQENIFNQYIPTQEAIKRLGFVRWLYQHGKIGS